MQLAERRHRQRRRLRELDTVDGQILELYTWHGLLSARGATKNAKARTLRSHNQFRRRLGAGVEYSKLL
jgi:hypothetical protein